MVSECLSPPSDKHLDAQFPISEHVFFSSFLSRVIYFVLFSQIILLYTHYQQGVC